MLENAIRINQRIIARFYHVLPPAASCCHLQLSPCPLATTTATCNHDDTLSNQIISLAFPLANVLVYVLPSNVLDERMITNGFPSRIGFVRLNIFSNCLTRIRLAVFLFCMLAFVTVSDGSHLQDF